MIRGLAVSDDQCFFLLMKQTDYTCNLLDTHRKTPVCRSLQNEVTDQKKKAKRELPLRDNGATLVKLFHVVVLNGKK